MRRLARNRAFNDAVLPLLARYLGTLGIDLAGYSVAAKREDIDLDHMMNVAARFFSPDTIDEDGAIQAHVCAGINGISDLTGPRNLVLEALSDLDLSSDPKVRLTRMQGAMWAHMARSRPLRPSSASTIESEAVCRSS